MARQQAWDPLAFIVDDDHFGRVAEALWRMPRNMEEAGQLAAVMAQHSAALVVHEHRKSRNLEVKELAERIGVDPGWLSGQLNGRYIANLDDITRWAIALDDVTVLPVFDSLDGFRPPK